MLSPRTISPYAYADLLERATAPEATKEDVNALGHWFQYYGMIYWNGECFDADGHRVFPVYDEIEPDVFDIDHYEIE